MGLFNFRPSIKPPLDTSQSLGGWGEDWAAWHYRKKWSVGILDRNWTGKYGELDLILREGETLVFVEVKTRLASDQNPLQAYRDSKQREHMQLTAREYYSLMPAMRPELVRFDVALISYVKGETKVQPEITVFREVMEPVNFR